MSTPPSGDDELRLARPDNPPPRLLQSAVTSPELQLPARTAEERGFSRAAWIVITVAIVLVMSFAAAGIIYWRIQSRRFPVVVTIGVPEERAATAPASQTQPSPEPSQAPARPAHVLAPLIPVNPDMLHVTSIAMGTPPLAIVNGKRLAEGDSLTLSTSLGTVTIRVVSIEDGLVRFRHGGETIDVKMQTEAGKTRP